jgi:aconitate hydratase
LLDPFAARQASELQGMPLLLKTEGKTTTDHISPAGYWLRFRGHLDNISNNMFSGAISAFGGHRGEVRPHGNGAGPGELDETQKVARSYKASGESWVVVGDENYGEGSSREHAAMCPRLLGAGAVIARSFARIHESNLKKQAVLALTFTDPGDWGKVEEFDRVTVLDAEGLRPDRPVSVRFDHADGGSDTVTCKHTLNSEQIRWFWAGSALNELRA